MRSLGAVALAIAVLSACGGGTAPQQGGSAGETAGSQGAIVVLDGRGDLPASELVVGEVRQEGMLASHCWSRLGLGYCEDTPGLRKPSSFVELERNTTLTIEGDAERVYGTLGKPRPSSVGGEEGFLELDDEVRLDLGDGEERLKARPGRYVLEILAKWPKGDGYFSFGIRITAPGG